MKNFRQYFQECFEAEKPKFIRVLKAVPGSRMLIKASAMTDQSTCAVVQEGFAKEGIAADRLMLVAQQQSLVELASDISNRKHIQFTIEKVHYIGNITLLPASQEF